jgi:hypothetical protein
MASCVNHNHPNFKALVKIYGSSLADLFTRTYSTEKKLLPKNEFYIPTNKEFLEWYKSSKENTFKLVDYSLLQNPRLSKKAIRGMLKGVIHRHNGADFITSGRMYDGSSIIGAEAAETIYGPNLRMMETLVKHHPDTFKIINTRFTNVKVVKITAPDETIPYLKRSPDINIKKKYFDKGNIQKTSVILERISDSAHPLNQVAKNLLKFLKINNPDIELVDVPYFEHPGEKVEKSSGYYEPTENKIYIAQRANVQHGLSEKLLLHEILHAFTYYGLREDTTSAKNFKKLYDSVIEKFGKYNPELEKDKGTEIEENKFYATFSIDEFIVALFTDSKFLIELQKLPPVNGIKFTNFLEEILDFIVEFLGLNKSPNMYQQAMGVASEILDTELARVEMNEQSDIGYEDWMLQKQDEMTLPSNASPKTLKLIKDFLKQVGVDINIVKDIVVNGVKQDADGVAQIMQKLVSVVEGKEASALPEEAMHFAVAIIKQTNPKLYQKLMKEINDYAMLNEVFRAYGNDPLYQKDGKPDVIKLKEEAVAKVLVDTIIQKADGRLDKPGNLAKSQSWWRSIVDWVKSLLYEKSGFDQAAIDIISGKSIGTANDIREEQDATFLQKTLQEKLYDLIKSTSDRIGKRFNANGDEKYFIGDKEIPFRVTDFAKSSYEKWKQRNSLPESDYELFLNELRREKGEAGHLDFENAFKLFIDENGYFIQSQAVRDQKITNDNYQSATGDQSIYLSIRDHLQERLASYDANTRFLSEVKIYDGRNIGGTIDFMAIKPNGKIDILDWKFMSLDTENYSDVPSYKVESWNIQMDQYKKILTGNYGVQPQDFEQTRMIPILAKYSKGKKDKEGKIVEEPKLTGVKIGNVDVTKIEEDESYLLPVPTADELTGSRQLDKLLDRLNQMYDKFKGQKVPESEWRAKSDNMKSLFSAIRKLQVKRDVAPLISQVSILNKKVESLIDRYNNTIKNKDWSKMPDKEVEAAKSAFLKELDDAEFAIKTYTDLNKSLKSVIKDEKEYNDLLKVADKADEYLEELQEINREFVSQALARDEGFLNFLSPEKLITKFQSWFASTSTVQIKSVQLLFRKANRAFGRATIMTEEANSKLFTIRDNFVNWAKSKGFSQKEQFSIIQKKDKNELIDQYKPEFYKKLDEAIKNGDITWIKDNTDVSALKVEMEKERQKEYEYIKNKVRDADIEQQAIQIAIEQRQADKKYNIDNDQSLGWYLKNIIRKHPKKETWETQEWKTLNKPENAPAKAFYDYIIEQNNQFADLQYISKQEARTFLPFVRSTLIEAAIMGNKLSLGERFFRSISVDEGDVGSGQRDPDTGQIMNKVPIYFTNEFTDGDYSNDLFRNMALYNEAAYRYKYISEIEDQIRAIAKVERNKQTIQTSVFGKAELNELNEVQYNPAGAPGATGNIELYESMTRAIIYGQKYVDNTQLDAVLLKLGGWGKKFNETLGINVFPENLEGKQITLNKLVDNLNTSFSFATLGLNIGSSLSNLFGGSAQSAINSGKYFTKKDFVSAEMQIFVNKFNGENKTKFIKALEYFMPLTDNYNREIAKKLSTNIITEEGFQDFIMSLMRNADRAVQTANFYAFLSNSVVVDGRVLNARGYV